MAKGKNLKPLYAVQKAKKYNPANLQNTVLDKRILKGNELKVWEREKIYFSSTRKQLLSKVTEDINQDFENKETYAPLVLQILCALGGATHITTLAEMFLMYAGHKADKKDFLEAYEKLLSLSIISTGKIAQGPRKKVQSMPVHSLEFVFVTVFGSIVAHSNVAKSMQIMSTSTKQALAENYKAGIQSASFISKLIKQNLVSHFVYHPTYVKQISCNGRSSSVVCRPIFGMNLKGCQTLYYNCRKSSGWLKRILKELEKASTVLAGKNPVIIVGAEDFYMISDLYKAIMRRKRIKAKILFTDDETQVKAKGKKFIYTLAVDKNRIVKVTM